MLKGRSPGVPLAWLKEALAERDRTEGCWEWPYGRFPSGYGCLWWMGKMKHTHAVALVLDGKPRPPAPANLALHSCHNKPCVNPAHLRWGTHQDNMDDREARRRYDAEGVPASETPQLTPRALGAESSASPGSAPVISTLPLD